MDGNSTSDWLSFSFIEISQPIGNLYVVPMEWNDLVRISYSDVRRIASETLDVEAYLGIERPLRQDRVAELRRYVNNVDASFPSTVILAVEEDDADFDKALGRLLVRNREDVAKVLDGQHRIEGLVGYEGDVFHVPVTIFVGMDIEDQAMVFATINLQQTKVNRSLAYDLYEYTKKRSPQKVAHNIVRYLDREDGSPFQEKFKILGTVKDRGETISQAQFIDSLLTMMSRDPMGDRNLYLKGGKPERADPGESLRLIFLNMFLDERDGEIALVLWNYFGAIEDRWGDYWRQVRPGFGLNRTTGFRALMGFLRDAYLSVAQPGDVPTRSQFSEIFDQVSLEGYEITPDNYPPGSSGQTQLREQLKAQTGLG